MRRRVKSDTEWHLIYVAAGGILSSALIFALAVFLDFKLNYTFLDESSIVLEKPAHRKHLRFNVDSREAGLLYSCSSEPELHQHTRQSIIDFEISHISPKSYVFKHTAVNKGSTIQFSADSTNYIALRRLIISGKDNYRAYRKGQTFQFVAQLANSPDVLEVTLEDHCFDCYFVFENSDIDSQEVSHAKVYVQQVQHKVQESCILACDFPSIPRTLFGSRWCKTEVSDKQLVYIGHIEEPTDLRIKTDKLSVVNFELEIVGGAVFVTMWLYLVIRIIVLNCMRCFGLKKTVISSTKNSELPTFFTTI
ncbi:hypothetical protein RCL1_004117 [Eukaryota sp. TZLM3-RCL]